MNKLALSAAGLALAVAIGACATPQQAAAPVTSTAPVNALAFTPDGKLVIPPNRDRWVTLGTTYALSYEGDGGTTFNAVRMDPASYESYVRTGVIPVGAMLDLEVRRPVEEVAPARGGHTQGAAVGRSMHVKDDKSGPGTWTFYTYPAAGGAGTAIPRTQACYTCHEQHAGTTDTVFMQFYPAMTEARARFAAAASAAPAQ
jgi:hypothetical protein